MWKWRKIRVTAGVLILALLFSINVTPTYAASAGLIKENGEYVTSAESSLVELANSSIGGTEQTRLFDDFGTIMEYAAYFDFLYTNKSATKLNVSKNELSVYAERLHGMCKRFNASYNKTSEQFKTARLKSIGKEYSYNTFVKFVSGDTDKLLVPTFKLYVTEYLDMLTGMDDATLRNDYVLEIESLYELLQELQEATATIENWEQNGSLSKSKASEILEFINEVLNNQAYGSIFDIGAQALSEKSSDEIYVDTDLSYIENMAQVAFNSKKQLEVEVTPKLKLAYLACFSASAVYTPFVSHVGSAEFTDALSNLTDAETAEDLLLLYNATKGYKKPLYKRTLSEVGDPTGTGTLITLEELISDIENGEMGALCTVVGELSQDSNMDWIYSQTGEKVTDESEVDVLVNFNGQNSETVLDNYHGALNFNVNVNGNGGTGAGGQGGNNFNFFNTNGTNPVDDGTESTEDTEDTEDTGDTGDSVGAKECGLGNLFDKVIKKVVEEHTVQAYVADGFSENDTAIGTAGGNDVYAHDSITDASVLSAPVMLYGTKYARAIDNMTTALMTNILLTESWVKNLASDDATYLYVNCYGDIVLSDDTVVLPGAANPLYYKSTAYNPFTVAFMNSYPTVLKNTGKFRVASKSDIGKYLIFGIFDGTGEYTSFVATKIVSRDAVEVQGPIKIPLLETDFYGNFGEDSVTVLKTRKLLFGDEEDNAWKDGSKYSSYCPLVINTVLTVDGNSVFPYDAANDVTRIVAEAIANSMYVFQAIDVKTLSLVNQHQLNEAYMLDAVIINALNGSQNATGYEEDTLFEYDNYVANSSSRKYKNLLSLCNNIFDKIKGLSGVIGIKSVYDNPVAGNALNVFSENIFFFFFAVVLVLLVFFCKVRLDVFQFVVFSFSILTGAYIYVATLPSVLPAAFNLFTNNMAQTISYEILSVDAEHYSLDKATNANTDNSGYLDLDSTSITLYKVRGSERTDFAKSVGADSSEMVGGNVVVINENAGVYAKNDEICVNTNALFDTLKITGKVNADYSYTLSAKKTVSNNVDYYIPYYQIVDSLIGKINGIAEIYSIPRKTSTYAGGVVKDNYLLYSYVNSKPFVTPGEYEFVKPLVGTDWTEEELESFVNEGMTITEELQSTYGMNVDWLGLADWLYNLSDAQKKTLWAQTMQDMGYYDIYWKADMDKMDALVTYVNYQTKKFVYDVSEQIGTLSDDVMIKIVSMRALIALTQKVSDFGHWMYPFTINYEEMSIDDVLCSIFISDYGRYVEMDMDVTEYMLEKHGWLNLIIFIVGALLLFVVTAALNWAVPIFYLMLGVLILVRLLIGEDFKDTLKGYLKVSLVLILCSTAVTLTVLAVKAMDGSVVGLYFMIIMTIVILYVLINLVLGVVRSVTDMGNSTLKLSFSGAVETLKSGTRSLHKHSAVKTNNLIYNQRGRTRQNYRHNSRYSLRNGVSDFYDNYSGMYDDYGETWYGDDQWIDRGRTSSADVRNRQRNNSDSWRYNGGEVETFERDDVVLTDSDEVTEL